MIDHLPTDPLTGVLPPPEQVVPGRAVLDDPGLALLRRTLPVLAVVAAPYAGLNGDQDPLNPLDREAEWARLVAAWSAASARAGADDLPLALTRLLPPTGAALGAALAAGGEDAFRVLHLVCHGERDMLYLEDEAGHESYVVAEHLVRLVKPGRVQLVVMEGCFSRRVADLLIRETGVEAVLGTWRRVRDDNALAFNTQLYASLSGGATVREAYRAARAALEARPLGQADRYDYVAGDDDLAFRAPDEARAPRPLLCEGLPPVANLPRHAGFVGRRDLLTYLLETVAAGHHRMVAFYGPPGIGKTWLAAEIAGRLAWRYPDGVLWFDVNPQTRAREVLAGLAALLGLPPGTAPKGVVAALNARRALLVLDRVDALTSAAELDQLAGMIAGVTPGGGAQVLAVGRTIPDALGRVEDTRLYEVGGLTPKAARTLAMRLAVERDVEALDVDTIDEFLERTFGVPWLIAAGVERVRTHGLDAALAELDGLGPHHPDPVAVVLGRRLAALSTGPEGALRLLVRAQGLPDAFECGLAEGLAGNAAGQAVDALRQDGLLRPDGPLLDIPSAVRAAVRERYPLTAPQQARIDAAVLRYLTQTPPADDEGPLTRRAQAWLNNVRAVLVRRTHGPALEDAPLAARALVVAAPYFRRAGLSEEFLHHAEPVRAALGDGRELAQLQTAIGEALETLPGRESEAGWAFQVARTVPDLDPATLAEASHHYARHLVRVGQAADAAATLQDALQALLKRDRTDPAMAGRLAHDWANALVDAGRVTDAIPRFQAALAAYARVQDPVRAATAYRDLGRALLSVRQLDRAEEALGKALALVDRGVSCVLAGECRHRLARIHAARAEAARRAGQAGAARDEWEAARRLLADAVADLLPCREPGPRADAFLDLGRVQARLGHLDDAAAHAERAGALFARAGDVAGEAGAAIFLGQVRVMQGDSAAAQATLHRALDLATPLPDRRPLEQAADALVRVHTLRARHASTGDRAFRRSAADQASFSRAALAGLGLDEQVARLDAVLHDLAAS